MRLPGRLGSVILSRFCDDPKWQFAPVPIDLSAFPVRATVLQATLALDESVVDGRPFETLGRLNVYLYDYGTLNMFWTRHYAAYPPRAGALVRFCSSKYLKSPFGTPELATAVQRILGSSRFQMRFQFDQETDQDGE